MLSHSWFKLQFWPKDATIHSSLKYMGWCSVKYMIQQHMVRKAQDDFHYTGVGYKYAKEYAVSICDLASFNWTNDMISIKYSWRTWFLSYCFILRALGSCWKKNEVFQVAAYDFSNLLLCPTIILINHTYLWKHWRFMVQRKAKRFVNSNYHQFLLDCKNSPWTFIL